MVHSLIKNNDRKSMRSLVRQGSVKLDAVDQEGLTVCVCVCVCVRLLYCLCIIHARAFAGVYVPDKCKHTCICICVIACVSAQTMRPETKLGIYCSQETKFQSYEGKTLFFCND